MRKSLSNQNGNYVLTGTYENVVIDGAQANVTLRNVFIDTTGKKKSAVFVQNGANVKFILEGESTIKGDNVDKDEHESCGIEVGVGTNVIFGGEGTLNVYGGRYGAAIGSWGTRINIDAELRRQVGTVTINSGNINAHGGINGAGIGSGYHVHCNRIVINGGVVHAYGNGLASGIGTGYGTSGGAMHVAAVGEYDSGHIIITGGEVYAAAYERYDLEALGENYASVDLAALNAADPQHHSAGIGGGYGSSAPDIQITGGKVVALGSNGGAGIGAGRGTSKIEQINPDEYCTNIIIGGDADVTAFTASSRTNEFATGGAAAIGAGRGTYDCGNITLTGNAKVKAISASVSPAIGVSSNRVPYVYPDKSEKNPPEYPRTLSISVGNDVTLYAVSMGPYAVDKDAISLSIDENYFGSTDRWFFEEDAVAISDINNAKAESPCGDKTYTVPVGSVSLWANIIPPRPVIPKANLKIIAPLAMAVRFEDGDVKYSGEYKEVEIGRTYEFQMCSVDWSTRTENGEKKVHTPGQTFYPNNSAWDHTNHGIYSDDGVGLRGTVVYRVTLVPTYGAQGWDAETKTFTLHKGNYVLRTDVNKCFMAYRFYFKNGNYGKQTGIDKVVYDTGKYSDHVNTVDDFIYNKPLESLSVNLPLGSTVTANAYIKYVYQTSAQVYVEIDSEHQDRCYTDYYWDL